MGLRDGGGGDSEAGEDAGDDGDEVTVTATTMVCRVGTASVYVSRFSSRLASPPLEQHTT